MGRFVVGAPYFVWGVSVQSLIENDRSHWHRCFGASVVVLVYVRGEVVQDAGDEAADVEKVGGTGSVEEIGAEKEFVDAGVASDGAGDEVAVDGVEG